MKNRNYCPGPLQQKAVHAPTMLNEAYDYPRPSSFSRGMRIDLGEFSMVFLSGTASLDGMGRSIHIGDFRAQTHRTFANLAEAQNDLGVALMSASKLDEAGPHFEKALEINPQFAEAHCYLGIVLYYSQGDLKNALAHWRQALHLQPNNLLAMNQEAYALAASPESDERNYGEALKLAQQAVQLSAGHDPTALDTLAIAYAAAGKFTDADQTAHWALELAAEQHRTQLVEALNTKIKLYKANQPYRDTWDQFKNGGEKLTAKTKKIFLSKPVALFLDGGRTSSFR